eukprot:6206996-Pleurochrysis_carterae.AAC.1
MSPPYQYAPAQACVQKDKGEGTYFLRTYRNVTGMRSQTRANAICALRCSACMAGMRRWRDPVRYTMHRAAGSPLQVLAAASAPPPPRAALALFELSVNAPSFSAAGAALFLTRSLLHGRHDRSPFD